MPAKRVSLEAYQRFIRGERLAFSDSPPMFVPAKRWAHDIHILPSCIKGWQQKGHRARIVSRHHHGVLCEIASPRLKVLEEVAHRGQVEES